MQLFISVYVYIDEVHYRLKGIGFMNNKHLLTISILLITAMLLSACNLPFTDIDIVRGSGIVVSEMREVSGFEEIELNGFGQLIITQGEKESLEIEAEDNVLEHLRSDVEGDTLILGFKDSGWRDIILGNEDPDWQKKMLPTEPVIYRLSVINLNSLSINGAGDLEMKALETGSFDLIINGAGTIQIDNLDADSLLMQINGSGDIEISGSAATQEIIFDGASNYDGSGLQTSETIVVFNGVGNATVWATETLEVAINGGGGLSYYGNPSVTQVINGGGDITNLGIK